MKTKTKKKVVYDNVKRNLYNILSNYYNYYSNIADEEKERMDKKYDPKNSLNLVKKKVNHSWEKLFLKE